MEFLRSPSTGPARKRMTLRRRRDERTVDARSTDLITCRRLRILRARESLSHRRSAIFGRRDVSAVVQSPCVESGLTHMLASKKAESLRVLRGLDAFRGWSDRARSKFWREAPDRVFKLREPFRHASSDRVPSGSRLIRPMARFRSNPRNCQLVSFGRLSIG